MPRIIHCQYLQKDAEGLTFQTYPGELGKQIFDTISKDAWQLWLTKQTMLINEKKLNMLNADDKALLETEMRNFLFHGVDVKIDGYTPEK